MIDRSFDNLIIEIKKLNKQQKSIILKLLNEENKRIKQVLTDDEYLFITDVLRG